VRSEKLRRRGEALTAAVSDPRGRGMREILPAGQSRGVRLSRLAAGEHGDIRAAIATGAYSFRLRNNPYQPGDSCARRRSRRGAVRRHRSRRGFPCAGSHLVLLRKSLPYMVFLNVSGRCHFGLRNEVPETRVSPDLLVVATDEPPLMVNRYNQRGICSEMYCLSIDRDNW
jgi:hypothetical protein